MPTAPEVSRTLVVDDEPQVRAAYRELLSDQEEFEIVGEAADGHEAVAAFEALQPRIALMDLQMPHLSGVEATRRICVRWPQARVVALTALGSRDWIVAALRAGAAGYLLKDLGRENLLAGMRLALRGEMPLSSSVRRALVTSVLAEAQPPAHHPEVGLSSREKELLVWLAHGLTNHQIATRMHVSEGSVKQYLTRIGAKLGVTSRTQILIRAIQLDIVDPHELPVLGPGEHA